MSPGQLHLMQRVASLVQRARAVPAVEDYLRRFGRRDFKRFLSEGPDFDALEIVRAGDTAS